MTRNYSEEDSVKKGLASLAVALGASAGDVAQIDADGNVTLAPGNGGSMPAGFAYDAQDDIVTVSDDNNQVFAQFQRANQVVEVEYLGVDADAAFNGEIQAYSNDGPLYFETDPTAHSGAGAVKLNGVELVQGKSTFPVSLAEGEEVRFSVTGDPTTLIRIINGGGALSIQYVFENALQWTLAGGQLLFANAPVIPATPTAQDVTDALSTLGLVTQAP